MSETFQDSPLPTPVQVASGHTGHLLSLQPTWPPEKLVRLRSMPCLFSQLTLPLGKDAPSAVCVRVMGATSPCGRVTSGFGGKARLESLWR